MPSINLPSSITSVGSGAFCSCDYLKSVVFAPSSNEVTMGGGMFSECFRLFSVTLPQKMDKIGDDMFLNCRYLSSLTIPNGVTEIGDRAFSSCGMLVSLTVPATVERIGTAAFAACPLNNIYFGGTEQRWSQICRDYAQLNENAVVHYETTGPEQPTPPQGSLTKNDFTYTAPADLTYDGTEKAAKVEPKSGLSAAVGAVKVKYYKDGAIASPVNVGTYTVKIDVAASADYAAVTDLEVGSFTITAKALTGSLSIAASGEEGTITRETALTYASNPDMLSRKLR